MFAITNDHTRTFSSSGVNHLSSSSISVSHTLYFSKQGDYFCFKNEQFLYYHCKPIYEWIPIVMKE